MRVYELTDDECVTVLESASVGRLACALFGQPYIVPIHFSFDRQPPCLYAVSAAGQKVRWMRQNPRVCVEVEAVQDGQHWTTVLAVGRYREILRRPEDEAARCRAEALFDDRDRWWLPAAAKLTPDDGAEMVLYCIEIDRLSGRRTARPPDPAGSAH